MKALGEFPCGHGWSATDIFGMWTSAEANKCGVYIVTGSEMRERLRSLSEDDHNKQ